MAPARARHPGGLRGLDGGRSRPPGGLQGDRAGEGPAQGDPGATFELSATATDEFGRCAASNWHHHQEIAMPAATPSRDPRVDAYLAPLPDWQQAICREVRELIHEADPAVVETIKRT